MDKLLGDSQSEPAAGDLLDEMYHYVEHRRPPGAGEHVAVDNVKILRELEPRIADAKHVQVFPVHRAAPPGEQPRLGEEKGTGAYGTDSRTVACEATQLVMDLDVAFDLGRLKTCAYDHHVRRAQVGERALGRDSDPVAGLDGAAVHRPQLPFEKPRPTQTVGRAQWLDTGRKRHHREAGDEKEGHLNGSNRGFERHRASFPAGALPGLITNLARTARLRRSSGVF